MVQRLATPGASREIMLDSQRQLIEVTDVLRCEGSHDARRSWHFAEDCLVQAAGTGLKVTAGNTQVWLEPQEILTAAHVHRAGASDQGGWVSRQFGRKLPATTVHWHAAVNGQTTLRTRITWKRSRGLGV